MSRSFLHDLIRAVGWHRRLLASVAAAATVYCTVSALSPAPPETTAVLAAARDLPGGTTPSGRDLRTIRLPPAAVPSGALRADADVAGRVLAAPVRAGEPLTDVRFVAPGLVRRLGVTRSRIPSGSTTPRSRRCCEPATASTSSPPAAHSPAAHSPAAPSPARLLPGPCRCCPCRRRADPGAARWWSSECREPSQSR